MQWTQRHSPTLFGGGTKPGLWTLDWSSNTELTSNITTQVSYILDISYLIVEYTNWAQSACMAPQNLNAERLLAADGIQS